MDVHPRVPHLVHEVREKCPFYADLYKNLSSCADLKLTDLPVVNHADYWAAFAKAERQVLTGLQSDGVVMKTGGTTSVPKYSLYSQAELLRTSSLLAKGLLRAGLNAGDRVGNMFYSGDLYGSFLLHILSVISLPIPAIQVPIGGLLPPSDTAELLENCRVTAILSTVTSLMRLADYCKPRGQRFESITAVMFGGEPLFQDQQTVISQLFPRAVIRSCIYGSMDAGVVATTAGAKDVREHRVLDEAVLVEIITDSGPTKLPGVRGTLVVTNLIRDLMPVLRYPTGDLAEWVDQPAGIFRLLGRSQSAVRLGPVSLDVSHVRLVAQQSLPGVRIEALQLLVQRNDGKDALQVKLVANPSPKNGAMGSFLEQLYAERPMLQQHVDLGLIAPVTVDFTTASSLRQNGRSGKLPEIMDLRVD